jgi:hypothetical protein
MSRAFEVNAIRSALGLSIREAFDAFEKYRSAEAAIAALRQPEELRKFVSTTDLLIAERALTKELLAALRAAEHAMRNEMADPEDTGAYQAVIQAIAKAQGEQA